MSRLTLRQLELFRAVMRTGTLTAAADALGISQPSASRILRYAEHELGITLFEREAGRLRPTSEARALFPDIEKIFEDLAYVRRVASDLGRLQAGRLRIAAIPSLAMTLVAESIARFTVQRPGISITVQTALNFEVPEAVLAGRADMGLAFQPAANPDLEAVELRRAAIVAVMPPGHALARRERIEPRDLMDQHLVTFSPTLPIGEVVAGAFRAAGLRHAVTVEVGQSFVACALVQAGSGVALVDELVVRSGAFPGLEVRPFDPPLDIAVVLLTVRGRHASRLAASFANQLVAASRVRS